MGIDLQAIQGIHGGRGIGVHAARLIEGLCRFDDLDFVWFSIPGRFLPRMCLDRGEVVAMNTHNYDAWFHAAAWAHQLDAFHVTSPFDDWPIPARASAPCPLIATVYDLLPIRLPFYFHSPSDEQRYLARLGRIRQYQSILTISQAVQEDLVAMGGIAPSKITVIGAGVESDFREIPQESVLPVLRKYGIRGPFVMCTGGDDPRKNLIRLVEGFSKLQPTFPRIQLVIVCSLSLQTRSALTRIAMRLGVADSLVLTGYVPHSDLIALYNGCRVYVFPSLGEGFGMPLLEAMACGAPAVTSNHPPMTEIGGDAALYADPFNPSALAETIQSLLGDEHARLTLRAKGIRRAAQFHWESVARATRQAYAETCIGPGSDAMERMNSGSTARLPPDGAGPSGYHCGWPGTAWYRQGR